MFIYPCKNNESLKLQKLLTLNLSPLFTSSSASILFKHSTRLNVSFKQSLQPTNVACSRAICCCSFPRGLAQRASAVPLSLIAWWNRPKKINTYLFKKNIRTRLDIHLLTKGWTCESEHLHHQHFVQRAWLYFYYHQNVRYYFGSIVKQLFDPLIRSYQARHRHRYSRNLNEKLQILSSE